MFKSGTATMYVTETCCQLLACCDPGLEESLFQSDPDIDTKSETTALEAMKALAVIDIAATVCITELLSMKQEHGKGVHAYLTCVRGKANICALSKKCQCGTTVSYTDYIIKWVTLWTVILRHRMGGVWSLCY